MSTSTNTDDADSGRTLLVGCGLLGGSLARALLRVRPDRQIFAVDSGEVIDWGRGAGLLAGGESPEQLPAYLRELEPDLIVLACPMDAIVAALPRVAAASGLRERPPLVVDLGSVKSTVVAAARACACPRFVGGHPMAGNERAGIAHADADLFTGKPFILCADASAKDREAAEALVRELGAWPLWMDPAEHDRHVALTSHLPHLLAYTLMALGHADAGIDLDRPPWSIVGGSWRDLTRVAASSPPLWEQILAHNRPAVLDRLDALLERLHRSRDALAQGRPALADGPDRAALLSALCLSLRAGDRPPS